MEEPRPVRIIISPSSARRGEAGEIRNQSQSQQSLALLDPEIRHVCEQMAEQGDYRALARFIRTSRRIYLICRPVLERAKNSLFVFEVTDSAALAAEQFRTGHPESNNRVFFVRTTEDNQIADAVSIILMTGGSFAWMVQKEYNREDPDDYGWKSTTVHPKNIQPGAETRKLLNAGYRAVLVYRGDDAYQYDEMTTLVETCRKRRDRCVFFYHVVK